MIAKRQMVLNHEGLIETVTVDQNAPPTPADALAAWEAADRRKAAAKQEQQDSDAAWVQAAQRLAEVIDMATGGRGGCPVMIGHKVVEIEWDEYWQVTVRTPEVIG